MLAHAIWFYKRKSRHLTTLVFWCISGCVRQDEQTGNRMSKMWEGATSQVQLISTGGNANKGGNATATRPVRQKTVDRAVLGHRGKVSNTIISQPRRHSGSQPILTL